MEHGVVKTSTRLTGEIYPTNKHPGDLHLTASKMAVSYYTQYATDFAFSPMITNVRNIATLASKFEHGLQCERRKSR